MNGSPFRTILSSYPLKRFARCPRWLGQLGLVVLLLGAATAARAVDDSAAAVEKRLAEVAEYLASDQLQGRGVGTEGIERAADYIAEQFAAAGLKTDLIEGGPMQPFFLPAPATVGPNNQLALRGPAGADAEGPGSTPLESGQDFTPLFVSGNGQFDLPLVFAGYGITAEEEGYDDYAGLDVEAKMVVILRHEPQRDDPQSVFDGSEDSPHAQLRRKLANALKHRAAGVLLCTDRNEIEKAIATARRQWQEALDQLAAAHQQYRQVQQPNVEQLAAQRQKIGQLLQKAEACSRQLQEAFDPLMPFAGREGPLKEGFPIVHCRRQPVDRMLKAATGTSLAVLEQKIDEGPTPHSCPLSGWRAVGCTDLQREAVRVRNVIGVLETEGPLANETLVIGAHYDHLGSRQRGLLGRLFSTGGEEVVYNGADDNASGVAAMIEIARTLAHRAEPLQRRVVFIAFTAEERGLLGSRHYVDHPLIPLEKTVAMLNLDMVGRLRERKLIVCGTGTAQQFPALLEEINRQHGLDLDMRSRGVGGSDHMSFIRKRIPSLHFITGIHADLHRPSDDFEKLNIAGMREVTALVTDVAVAVANAEQRLEYVSATADSPLRQNRDRAFLGVAIDTDMPGPGCPIREVDPAGPAGKAGLKAGDCVVQFGERKINSREDLLRVLRRHRPGDQVAVTARRGEAQETFDVTLGRLP